MSAMFHLTNNLPAEGSVATRKKYCSVLGEKWNIMWTFLSALTYEQFFKSLLVIYFSPSKGQTFFFPRLFFEAADI